MSTNDRLDVYEMSDSPEACRKCGTRTTILHEYVDDGMNIQLHQCPSCGYRYEIEWEDDRKPTSKKISNAKIKKSEIWKNE